MSRFEIYVIEQDADQTEVARVVEIFDDAPGEPDKDGNLPAVQTLHARSLELRHLSGGIDHFYRPID